MAKEKTTDRSEGANSSGLPLLYKKPVLVNAVRHIQATVSVVDNFSFAETTNSIPLNTIEFIEAAKTYPIVFGNSEAPLPVAIVGLEQTNYFINSDKTWQKNSYIPAYIRQYPFIFFENSKENTFHLCIDEASPHFQIQTPENAKRLYDDKGNPTETTNNAMKFCTAFYQHHVITRNFCNDLKEYKLLQPYRSDIALKSGRKASLTGFQIIDEKALNSLSNKDYLALRDKGWIPFIYFALASISNWQKLVDMEASAG